MAVDTRVTDSEQNRPKDPDAQPEATQADAGHGNPMAVPAGSAPPDPGPSDTASTPAQPAPVASASQRSGSPVAGIVIGLLGIAAAIAVGVWSMQRFGQIEGELARRLQGTEQKVATFETALSQSGDRLRDLQSRNAALESRLTETAGLQAQVEKLFQERAEDSLEVQLAETESALALAAQQLALGADAESVLAALQSIDGRLSRQHDPRLAPVRAALARDIERLRVHPASDVGRLALRIDALLAGLDHLPLLASVREGVETADGLVAAAPAGGEATPAAASPAAGSGFTLERIGALLGSFGRELRTLFQVRQVDNPEAVLVAPQQAYFLRQNLRLMLLNARLGLLSRNAEVYHADLERAHHWVDVYYDGEHRNVVAFKNQLRQLFEVQPGLEQARIDDSLAAVRTARAAVR